MKHAAASLIVALLLTLCASSLFAHGGDPLPRRVHEPTEGQWLLSTNFGLMSQADPTHYVCEEAFLGGDNFRVVAFDQTTWVTFSASAVMRTEDGCDFERIADLSSLPTAVDGVEGGDRVAYIAQNGADATLFLSTDRGASFEEYALTPDEDVRWTGVGLLESGGMWLAAYSREDADNGAGRLFAYDTAEETLSPVEVLDGTKYPYVFDTKGGRIAGLATRDSGLALFWGAPDGAWHEQTVASWPADVRLSDDGVHLYAASALEDGGVLHGIWRDEPEPMWETLAPGHSARCVGEVGEAVYVCGQRAIEGYDLAPVDEDPTQILRFKNLEGPPPRCPSDSKVAQTCPVVWPELAKALRIELPGQPDTDMDMGEAMPEPPMDMGSGVDMPADPMTMGDDQGSSDEPTCSSTAASPQGPAAVLLWAIVLGGVGRVWRRRRSEDPMT